MKMKTSKGNWKLHGVNVIPSDAVYQKVKEAIETGNLSQEHLQRETGHRYPIIIDIPGRSVTFAGF